LHTEFEINSDLWKFELLNLPQLGERAALEAAQADMIIISTRGTGELPAHVKKWIERWLPQKTGGQSALVALLHPDPAPMGEWPPLCAYLRQVAERGNMDFFWKAGDWRPQDSEHAVETLHRQTEHRSFLLDRSLQHRLAGRGWGLNE